MECIEIKVDEKILGRKTLLKGEVNQIIIDKYYDLDDMIIDEGRDTLKYRDGAQFEIISTKKKIFDHKFDWWTIKVDGKNIGEDWELTSYDYDGKSKLLKLRGCTGAG